jgi:ribosome biogenesis GTPase A
VLKSDLEIEAINAVAENNWVSKPLSPDEIAEFNARLGVVADEGQHYDDDIFKERRQVAKDIKYKEDYLKTEDGSYDHKIKGFLDWNPSNCSGCGTPFQSKTPDSPGYLSKEKFSEHRIKSELIRKQQDAVQLLDVAGIAANSPLAVEILLSAGTSQEVIDGVVKLGHSSAVTATQQESASVDRDRDASSSMDIDNEDVVAVASSPTSQDDNDENSVAPPVDKSVVFGYDPETLEPIYDLDTFRKSFEREKNIVYENKKKTPADVKDEINEKAISICQRCFRLQAYGDVENHLRPGWSDHELLTPERFSDLLSQIKNTKAVVLCLIDLFDIEGSLLSNLNEIAGRNPIIIAANKVDLLPNDAVLPRVNDWVYSSVKDHCHLLSPKEAEIEDQKEYMEKGWYRSRIVGSGSDKEAVVGILRRPDVHLISCETGRGINDTLKKVVGLAASHGEKIYVMGTANVGKSSFINRLLEFSDKNKNKSKRSKGKKSKRDNITPQATVSNLPGTTLDFLKIRLPNGIVVYDTPGLINEGQLTSRLTPHELRQVIPKRQMKHITLRMEQERVIMLGGLARIEHMEVRVLVVLLILHFCTCTHIHTYMIHYDARKPFISLTQSNPVTNSTTACYDIPLPTGNSRAVHSCAHFLSPTRCTCTPPGRTRWRVCCAATAGA